MFKLSIEADTADELQDSMAEMARIFDVRPDSPTVAESVAPPPPAPVPVPGADPTTERQAPESAWDATDLDAQGFPYDARINSNPPNKKKGDGCWKLKKKVDKGLVAQVQGELRLSFPAPAAAAALGTPPLAVLPAPALPTPPPPAPEPTPGEPTLVHAVSAAAAIMNFSTDPTVIHQVGLEIKAVLSTYGLDGGLPALTANPQFVNPVYQGLVEIATRRGIPLA